MMSNVTGDDEGSFSSRDTGEEVHQQPPSAPAVCSSNSNGSTSHHHQPPSPAKKKRKRPGNPDSTAEVIPLSPKSLMTTNTFMCNICNEGFNREQNLQVHRTTHKVPWKPKQKTTTEARKRVYICPEPTCVHHDRSRALGDLTGIKKHFSRKHGEKNWECFKCSKKYALQSDRKAHQKTCGTREFICHCGAMFSRKDDFISHRALCDAPDRENNEANQETMNNNVQGSNLQSQMPDLIPRMPMNSVGISEFGSFDPEYPLESLPQELFPMPYDVEMFSSSSDILFDGGPITVASSSSGLQLSFNSPCAGYDYLQDGENGGQISGSAHMSVTDSINSPMMQKSVVSGMADSDQLSAAKPPYYGEIQPDQSSLVETNSTHHPQEVPRPFESADGGGFIYINFQ